MFIVQKDYEGYVFEITDNVIGTTLNYNKIIYFEKKTDALNLVKFLNEYDEFSSYRVKEVKFIDTKLV